MNDTNQDETYHLIGGGGYDNLMTYHLVVDDQYISLEPLGIAWSMMVVSNLFFLAFFTGFFYLATLKENPWWVYCFIVVVAVATCLVFDTYTYIRFRNSIRRGPILRYDRGTGEISLPDRGMKFSTCENINIECLTSWQEGGNAGDSCSELNFVVANSGGMERFNLLRSVATLKPFGKLTAQLRSELPIPVKRVRS